jgi:hypothetical protein
MNKNFISLVVMLVTCLLAKSQTPFSNAILKLQDGSDMPLLEVPWFKNQVTMWSGKHSFYSNDYFIVYSAPKSCPSSMSFSYAYATERGGAKNPREFLKTDKKYGEVETLKQCNTYLQKQIIDLSDDIKEKCKCKKVMQTIKHASNKNDDSIWESLDDEILSNHELIFRFNISSLNQKEPILFSLGSNNAGIYDVRGNKLCSYEIPIKLEFNMNYLKKIRENNYKISCTNDLNGTMELSKLNFSFLQGDLIGEIRINFSNGEQYVIKK